MLDKDNIEEGKEEIDEGREKLEEEIHIQLLDEDGNNNNNNGSTWTWKLHPRDSELSLSSISLPSLFTPSMFPGTYFRASLILFVVLSPVAKFDFSHAKKSRFRARMSRQFEEGNFFAMLEISRDRN